MSNFAYSQTKISEYISFYFAMLGVGCAIIGSEMTSAYNENGQTDDWIKIMYIICDVSSLILSKILKP